MLTDLSPGDGLECYVVCLVCILEMLFLLIFTITLTIGRKYSLSCLSESPATPDKLPKEIQCRGK